MKSMSLRSRIILTLAAAQIFVVLGIGTVLIANARGAVVVEVDASLRMARSLVLATVATLKDAVRPEELVASLPSRLIQPRHTRIAVLSPDNDIVGVPTSLDDTPPRTAPAWFSRLMEPSIRLTRLPVAVDGRVFGIVLISAFPDDEIAEVWEDARDLLLLLCLAFAAQTVIFALVVKRSLAPLGQISAAIDGLATGLLTERAPAINGPDLGPLAQGVNALGEALEKGEQERRLLSLRLIARGDEERKAVARDLHDEFGPCIFGLKVEAGAIRDRAGADQVLRDHAANILSIAAQIQSTNSSLLASLRPMAVGLLPLPAVLEDMVAGLRKRSPEIDWSLVCDAGLPRFDETTELTIYRVVQEGTTNVMRHAQASQAMVTITAEADLVLVQVEDDGVGLSPTLTEGNGLSGMRERVTALGGRISISHKSGGGTVIDVSLPGVSPAEEEAPS